MRSNQLSVKIERFGTESENGKRTCIQIYSDGNDLIEVTARSIEQIRKRFFPDIDKESFYDSLRSVDTDKPYFGVTETYNIGNNERGYKYEQ